MRSVSKSSFLSDLLGIPLCNFCLNIDKPLFLLLNIEIVPLPEPPVVVLLNQSKAKEPKHNGIFGSISCHGFVKLFTLGVESDSVCRSVFLEVIAILDGYKSKCSYT